MALREYLSTDSYYGFSTSECELNSAFYSHIRGESMTFFIRPRVHKIKN